MNGNLSHIDLTRDYVEPAERIRGLDIGGMVVPDTVVWWILGIWWALLVVAAWVLYGEVSYGD